MNSVACTWDIIHTVDDGEQVSKCGKLAVMKYVVENPEKGPDKPQYLEYPRCRIHDTKAGRERAAIDNYLVVEF